VNKITCHIITIGDEILYGHILDTNSKWLSQKIIDLGITVSKKTSIGDNNSDINYNIKKSISNYNLTIITGGLGPTNDDITKNCLNNIFDGDLVYDKKTFNHIKKIFKERNFNFTQKNKDQALVPNNCKVLFNQFGTAPGMAFEKNKNILISLPGVPFEMKSLFENGCINLIKKKFTLPFIYHRMIKTVGIGESWLSDKISNWENNLDKDLSLAYLPSIGRVKLRLTGKGDDISKLKVKVKKEEKLNRDRSEEIISFLEIEDIKDTPVGKLPYGLQKKVELGRALATDSSIILLDEPMAGMNVEEKRDMCRFILKVNDELGTTMVLIEHDMGVVMDISDRVVVLDYGKVIGDGTPDEIMANKKVIDAYLGVEH